MNKISCKDLFNSYATKEVSAAPLAFFRIVFGFIMFASMVRFILKGWIYTLYIQPDHYFPFYGFEWVTPLPGNTMYIVFIILALSALCIGLGLFYRINTIVFFVLFTYVELIDKSNYLNHYYFISIIAFLLCLVPAGKIYSLDVKWNLEKPIEIIPAWCITIFKIQLAIVYFFAGIAKINYDWLIEAMPLRIWLPGKSDLPIIGAFLDELWLAYFFSWAGMLYDVLIPFLLFWRRTTYIGIVFVVIFHILTSILFPMIGMFPFIMLMAALIFLPETFHQSLFRKIKPFFSFNTNQPIQHFKPSNLKLKLTYTLLIIHFLIQILLPLRFLLYSGNLFWREEGFRFSWRVMLMEKAGYATFTVLDKTTNKIVEVNNGEFLSMQQEKMMSTQPDMILQYAKILEKEYIQRGMVDPEIYVESYVTLNGRPGKLFIDPKVDLTKEVESFYPKKWILDSNSK